MYAHMLNVPPLPLCVCSKCMLLLDYNLENKFFIFDSIRISKYLEVSYSFAC